MCKFDIVLGKHLVPRPPDHPNLGLGALRTPSGRTLGRVQGRWNRHKDVVHRKGRINYGPGNSVVKNKNIKYDLFV